MQAAQILRTAEVLGKCSFSPQIWQSYLAIPADCVCSHTHLPSVVRILVRMMFSLLSLWERKISAYLACIFYC